MLIGTLIYVFHLQEFFGGDALTYDFFGDALLRTWAGEKYYQTLVDIFIGGGRSSGWGMIYMVAAIYKVIGRNMLAIQYVNSVMGAATAPIAYLIALEIFPSKRIARACALLSAFFPSMVLVGTGLEGWPDRISSGGIHAGYAKARRAIQREIPGSSGARTVLSDHAAVLCFLHRGCGRGRGFYFGAASALREIFRPPVHRHHHDWPGAGILWS